VEPVTRVQIPAGATRAINIEVIIMYIVRQIENAI
jgi:hypothetical protein